MAHLLIKNGTLITMDPQLGDMADGDVLIEGSRIIAVGPRLTAPAGTETIDATGMVVFPGGVDVHTHVAGGALNFARAMTPEYAAPEQLRNHSFIETIRQREIGAWVFDEAHCLSKWGHDFRPEYRELGPVAKQLGLRQVTAFTATATPEVRRDIVSGLGLGLFGLLGPLGLLGLLSPFLPEPGDLPLLSDEPGLERVERVVDLGHPVAPGGGVETHRIDVGGARLLG